MQARADSVPDNFHLLCVTAVDVVVLFSTTNIVSTSLLTGINYKT